MNYSTAAKKAISEFERARKLGASVSHVEKTAQFRGIEAYESTGSGSKLQSVLFGLKFCDKEGGNYREVMIFVSASGSVDFRAYTIERI